MTTSDKMLFTLLVKATIRGKAPAAAFDMGGQAACKGRGTSRETVRYLVVCFDCNHSTYFWPFMYLYTHWVVTIKLHFMMEVAINSRWAWRLTPVIPEPQKLEQERGPPWIWSRPERHGETLSKETKQYKTGREKRNQYELQEIMQGFFFLYFSLFFFLSEQWQKAQDHACYTLGS